MKYSRVKQSTIVRSNIGEIENVLKTNLQTIYTNVCNRKYDFVKNVKDWLTKKNYQFNTQSSASTMAQIVCELLTDSKLVKIEKNELIRYISSVFKYINNDKKEIKKIIQNISNSTQIISISQSDNAILKNCNVGNSIVSDNKFKEIHRNYYSKIQSFMEDPQTNIIVSQDNWYLSENNNLQSIYGLIKRRIALAKIIIKKWQQENSKTVINDNLILNALVVAAVTINQSNWIDQGIYEKEIKRFYFQPCMLIIDGRNLQKMDGDPNARINYKRLKDLLMEKTQLNIVKTIFCQKNNFVQIEDLTSKNPFMTVLENNNIQIKSTLEDEELYCQINNRNFLHITSDDLIIEELQKKPDLPIILLSGDSDFLEYAKNYNDSGIDFYIVSNLKSISKRAIREINTMRSDNLKYIELTQNDLEYFQYYENKNNYADKSSKELKNDNNKFDILIVLESDHFKKTYKDLAHFCQILDLKCIKIEIKN